MKTSKRWEGATLGARAFALAWVCYGVFEVIFGVAVPGIRARFAGTGFPLEPWVASAILLAWPIAGGLLGAAVGAAFSPAGPTARSARLLTALGTASVLLALALHLARIGRLGASGLAVFAILAAGVALAWHRDGRWLAAAHPLVWIPVLTAWLHAVRIVALHEPIGPRIAITGGLLAAGAVAARLVADRVAARPLLSGRALGVMVVAALLALHTIPAMPPPALPRAEHPRAADVPRLPPVVMIVLDTVRADHLSTYGYPRETDPNLARFAARATVFEHALAPGDMTLTSHASLFTGRLAARHGAVPASPRLDGEEHTLAELLKAAGYRTAGISANCGWIEGNGIDQGFDYWDARCGVSRYRGLREPFLYTRLIDRIRRHVAPESAMWAWRSADTITDEALALLPELSAAGAPFLLFLNYMDVHRPIDPPEPYRSLYPNRLPGFDMMRDWSALQRGRAPTAAESAHLISQYDGALRFLDQHLGRFLDALERDGLLDRSLVLVLSDHGESFGSHGTFGHGRSVYQDVIGIPFVLKLPAQKRGRRVAAPVGLADVLPTVAAALGLEPPAGLDGRSILDPDGLGDRALVSESYTEAGLHMRALARGGDKIVVRPEAPTELYALDRDPEESIDRAAHEPELAAGLRRLLEHTLDADGAEAARTLSEQEAERLRALGYLE